MARSLRVEYPGAVYHITSRGNGRREIYREDKDRELFLEILFQVVSRFGWLCHAYCLMDNHYHLLIETPKSNLSLGMRQLNGVYTQKFNYQNRSVGHIFQGRFKAIVVEKEEYLLELCRYVVLNPVRARACLDPGEWKWSSYRATVGRERVPGWLTVDWVLGRFGSVREQAWERYREFVFAGLKEKPWKGLISQIYLGSKDFVRRLTEGKERIPEVPRRQWSGEPVPLEEIFGEGKSVDEGIAVAYLGEGYLLREIADYFGLHYSTVSRWLRRGERGQDSEGKR